MASTRANFQFAAILLSIIIILTICAELIKRRLKSNNYDYADIIIIGTGPGGCVCARRLHDEFPGKRVLVFERGADRHTDSKVFNVAKALEVAYSSPYSEVLETKTSHDLRELDIHPTVSVASMNGGASSHNFGLAVHGSPAFYDQKWKPHLGIGFKQLKRHFKKIEEFAGESEDKSLRGHKGAVQIDQLPVSVSKLSMIGPALKKAYSRYTAIEATKIIERTLIVAVNAGALRAPENLSDCIVEAIGKTRPDLPVVSDYNIEVEGCISKRPQIFVDGVLGLRSSADFSYLPITHESNPKIKQNTTVETLNWKTKKGVITCDSINWIDRNGAGKTKLRKNGRVILCAGGIYSPIILERSGLKEHNKHIGEGMFNHYGTGLVFETSKDFKFSSGPLAFVPSEKHGKGREWQLVIGSGLLIDPKVLDRVNLKQTDGNYIVMLTWILDPQNRGYVRDNGDGVDINLRMYEDKGNDDLQSIVESMRWMYQIVKEMKRSALFSGREKESDLRIVFPPQDVLERDDQEEMEDWVKIGLNQTDHYSGTCALGKVVDGKDFTVMGTSNIHVVDASTFPAIPNGNTEFPTLIMAEEAAERIIQAIRR